MKFVGSVAFVVLAVFALSSVETEASVYKSRSKASCNGVSKVREFSRGRSASCSGVSRSEMKSVLRSKRSCAG